MLNWPFINVLVIEPLRTPSKGFFIAISIKEGTIKEVMELENHNKLVRSKVIAKLKSKGIEHTYHMGSPEEHKIKLYEKLPEEAREFLESGDIGEFADVLEVLKAIQKLNGWTDEQIEQIRLEKLEKEGGFEEPFILEKCEKKA